MTTKNRILDTKGRIRDTWRRSAQNVSVEDSATAAAYVSWQLALAATKNLHTEDFVYVDDHQRVSVLLEYLVFLAHVTDRLAYERMGAEERKRFVTSFVDACAHHLQRNAEEILGSDDYRIQLIELLAARNHDYNQHPAHEGNPGYGLLRSFGGHVQKRMGTSQTNRWVMDQVITIDGPKAADNLFQSIDRLLKSAA